MLMCEHLYEKQDPPVDRREMFGVNIMNIFGAIRYFETTTILWLRFLSLAVVLLGAYLVYQLGPDAPWYVKGGAYLVVLVGVLSLIVFLLAGYSFVQTSGGTCVYCPSSTLKLPINVVGVMAPGKVSLPTLDPYTNTMIYYFVVNDIKGNPGAPVDEMRLMTKNQHYDLLLDSGTGVLSITSVGKEQSLGKLPLQGFVQVAVVQEQKEFTVYINGERRGSLRTDELPPTLAIMSAPIFNPDGIVREGEVYHMEVHSGALDTLTLRKHYESAMIQYTNDVAYQGTQLPTQAGMSFSQRLIGYVRMMSQFLGYSKGVETANDSF